MKTDISQLKIYLLDWNQAMCRAWEQVFENNVNIVKDNFLYFMREHNDIDGIVSPANCFGIMDGGYDAAITKFFGPTLMQKVQDKILNEYYGVQPIATCISVAVDGFKTIDGKQIFLLHTPVMTTPSKVYDPVLIFHAMRNTLMEALKLDLNAIVIPAWGGFCGDVPPDDIAHYMKTAYDQIKNPNTSIDWSIMDETARKLNIW